MDSPLARIQPPSRSQATPKLELPETLTLPDGREFNTRELLKQTSDSVNYNLRSKNPREPSNSKTTVRKYNDSDWTWMLSATIDAIMTKYRVNNQYAQVLRSKARKLVFKQKL
jgi:hypothetical protein